MAWIDVNERLPVPYLQVELKTADGKEQAGFRRAWLPGFATDEYSKRPVEIKNVTHWKPIFRPNCITTKY